MSSPQPRDLNVSLKRNRKNRRFRLSKSMLTVLSFIWEKENRTKRKPFEVDYPTLIKETSLPYRTVKHACARLKRDGWLLRVVLNPFGRRKKPRVVWRIPYGQFHIIREILSAEGNKADPIILSTIRLTHNPINRKELQGILNMKRRTLQRSLTRLKKAGKVEMFTEKKRVYTRKRGWKKIRRTLYRLPRKNFKKPPLTNWINEHIEWSKNQ